MFISIIIFSLLTLFFLIFFSKVAHKIGFIDFQNSRKIHHGSVPLVGGISIYISMLICSFIFDLPIQIFAAILFSSIILIAGLIDDIIELSVVVRISCQFVASLILIGSGLTIDTLGNYYNYSFELGIFGILLTFISVLTLTNAINFIDGIDGLCASIVLISLITLFVFVKFTNVNLNLDYLIYYCFIIFTFFLLNIDLLPIKKVFLGDSGSTFLGFFLAWVLIYYTQKELNSIHPILAIWCITLPCFDMLRVVILRILLKINPMKPDRNHIHHVFINIGFSNKKALILIVLLSISLNFFGGGIYYFFGSLMSILCFVITFVIYFLFINFLKDKVINYRQSTK